MNTLPEDRPYTPGEYLTLPDRESYELVNGQLIELQSTMRTSWVGGHLCAELGRFVDDHELGWVFPASCLYRCFSGPDEIRRPDGSFIGKDRYSWEQLKKDDYSAAPPHIVTEVLTPTDSIRETKSKITAYFAAAVKLVWVVIPHSLTVYIHRAGGSVTRLSGNEALSGEDDVPGFRCPLTTIFRSYW